jgi:hypothetical protein
MFPEMRIAGSELAVGIAYANYRATIEHVRRHTLVFHPATVDNAILVFAAKPTMAAEYLFVFHVGKSVAVACSFRL